MNLYLFDFFSLTFVKLSLFSQAFNTNLLKYPESKDFPYSAIRHARNKNDTNNENQNTNNTKVHLMPEQSNNFITSSDLQFDRSLCTLFILATNLIAMRHCVRGRHASCGGKSRTQHPSYYNDIINLFQRVFAGCSPESGWQRIGCDER